MDIPGLLSRLNSSSGSLYLLECGEVVVWDNAAQTVYSSVNTHTNTSLNPMVDLRTHLGHALLWGRHEEISDSSGEILNALVSIYDFKPVFSNANYRAYALNKKGE